MNTLIIEASGQTRFSWKSEHATSHFLHPLHLDNSLAIQIGSLLGANREPLKRLVVFGNTYLDLNVLPKKHLYMLRSDETRKAFAVDLLISATNRGFEAFKPVVC